MRFLLLAGLVCLMLGSASTHAADAKAATSQSANGYLAELQARALSLDLPRSVLWLNLLHFKPLAGIGPGRSLADDDDFFNDPEGRRNPQAELLSTLAAFFDDRLRKGQQPAQCRFRARYEWLREQLKFDPLRLPVQTCASYDAWREGVAASSLTLVYAAAYINSPASMFGHTLFRLNPPVETTRQALLAYSINYAVAAGASPDDLFFELKGLFGMYAGEFTNAPYYLRVREYSHMEDRDLWEYDLNLERPELERLLAHTWEMGYTRFDYWFFDENCSYQLLSLLDVARPTLHLADRFAWRSVPSDTVKAVVAVPGLVTRRTYRPSATSQIMQRAEALPEQDVRLARSLALGKTPPEAATDIAGGEAKTHQRARTLELAERYLATLGAAGKLGNDAVQARRMALLGQRAAMPELPDVPVPEPDTAPEVGHGTFRTEALAGRTGGGGQQRSLGRLNVYPAYHDLLDPDPGFTPGAQIRLFSGGLAWLQGGGLRLDHFLPVDVLSVAPQHTLRDGLSWKVNGGWRREFGADPATARLVFGLNGGPGLSWRVRGWTAYALADNQLWLGGSSGDRPLRVGTGVQVGTFGDLSPSWRLHLELRQRWFTRGPREETQVLLRQRVQLTPSMNALMQCEQSQRSGGIRRSECSLGLQNYW